MKRIRIISRADDCGGTRGANEAIFRAAARPFLKNISLMATGGFVEEAAAVLAGRKDLCFGMHFTMNSEWDGVKWRPIMPKERISTLLLPDGNFYPDPALYKTGGPMPDIEQVKLEWNAQLDRLAAAGFDIRYADTHMFPERAIPGLADAMSEWIAGKGLVDHRYFYRMLPRMDELSKKEGLFETVLSGLEEGQYFYLLHPALPAADMALCHNASVLADSLIRDRGKDFDLAVSEETLRLCGKYGAETIRYDEAEPV